MRNLLSKSLVVFAVMVVLCGCGGQLNDEERAQAELEEQTSSTDAGSCASPGSCNRTINPCCCDNSGHTGLKKCDPNYLSCSITCQVYRK